MRRERFVNGGPAKMRSDRKMAMVRDYNRIIDYIDSIPDEAEYDLDWDTIRSKTLRRWNKFYDTYMPQIGNKHKGEAIIGKNIDSGQGRKQLVRVMKMQIEKFINE